MHAQCVGHDRLDDVAVAAHQVGRVLAQGLVPVAYGFDGAVLHAGHRLAALAGNVMPLGWLCTTGHSGSLASFFSSTPVQSP